MGMGARGSAIAQKSQTPFPLRRIPTGPERKRCIDAPDGAQDHANRGRIGPRPNMLGRNLAAVCEAGFKAGTRLTVDDRHLVPSLRQVKRGRDANDACAKDQYVQGVYPRVATV